jgi:hypothetical protein
MRLARDGERKTMNDHLYDLAERVEASGHWRAGKARQFPNDKRNTRSSESLVSLAEKLNELPPAAREAALAYSNVMQRVDDLDDPDVAYEIVGAQSQYIGRYGFDYPADGNPALFLAGLAEQLAEIVERKEARLSEKEKELRFEAVKEAADEAAKEAAHEAAEEAAKDAAEEAAREAYDATYEEVYRETYEETYREALIEALAE